MNDATAKYQRAQVHLRALGDALNEFDGQRPWYPEKTDDVPEGMVRIRIASEPPESISVILGDAVHNLRSALDYATCSLVEFCDPAFDLKRTQFPFGRPDELLNSAERRCLGGIYPHTLNAIEEARRLGGAYLQLLNALSNQDKHRLLVKMEVRQYPMRVEVDHKANTAGFVPDLEGQPTVWFQPLKDGDLITMLPVLNLKVGLVLSEISTPFAIPAIDQVNWSTSMALKLMAMAVDTPDA
jgi:hypothetical protein